MRYFLPNQHRRIAKKDRGQGRQLRSAIGFPPDLADIVAVAGGEYHSLALRNNGTLVGWGYNGDGQTFMPTNLLRFVAISAGGSHNLAITEDAMESWTGFCGVVCSSQQDARLNRMILPSMSGGTCNSVSPLVG